MNALITYGLNDKPHRSQLNALRDVGIEVDDYIFGWQSGEPLEVLIERYREKVREVIAAAVGKIALVGISAGGAAALWGLQEFSDSIALAVNVCGIITPSDRTLIGEMFGSNAEKHCEMVDILDPARIDMSRVVSIRSKLDGLVKTNSAVIGDHELIDMYTLEHGRAINHAMKKIVPGLVLRHSA
jgi:pimeloyl-ACP methyl ester carboxylesterase